MATEIYSGSLRVNVNQGTSVSDTPLGTNKIRT